MRSPEAGGMREQPAPEKKGVDFKLEAAEWAAKEFQKLSAYDPHPSVELLRALKFVLDDQRREASAARKGAESAREQAREARQKSRPGQVEAAEERAAMLDEQAVLHEARVDALAAMMTEAGADVDAMLGLGRDQPPAGKKPPDTGAPEIVEHP